MLPEISLGLNPCTHPFKSMLFNVHPFTVCYWEEGQDLVGMGLIYIFPHFQRKVHIFFLPSCSIHSLNISSCCQTAHCKSGGKGGGKCCLQQDAECAEKHLYKADLDKAGTDCNIKTTIKEFLTFALRNEEKKENHHKVFKPKQPSLSCYSRQVPGEHLYAWFFTWWELKSESPRLWFQQNLVPLFIHFNCTNDRHLHFRKTKLPADIAY